MSREERNAAIAAERLGQAREVLRLQKDEKLTVPQACERVGITQATYGNWRNRAMAPVRQPRKVVKRGNNAARDGRSTLHTMEVPTIQPARLICFVGQPAEVLAAVRAM